MTLRLRDLRAARTKLYTASLRSGKMRMQIDSQSFQTSIQIYEAIFHVWGTEILPWDYAPMDFETLHKVIRGSFRPP